MKCCWSIERGLSYTSVPFHSHHSRTFISQWNNKWLLFTVNTLWSTCFQKIFEPVVQPQPRPIEQKPANVKVSYEGRDLLNLMGNLTDSRWNYRATVLPPNNPALFFANRSQYHRLGPYGTRTQYVKDSCRLCGFNWVVAATDWWSEQTNVEWEWLGHIRCISTYLLSLDGAYITMTDTDDFSSIFISVKFDTKFVADFYLCAHFFLTVWALFCYYGYLVLFESYLYQLSRFFCLN